MKLQAIITAALLSAGCWEGPSVCERSTLGQYRTDGRRLEHCEEAETKSGSDFYLFINKYVPEEMCISLAEDYKDYFLKKCLTEPQRMSRETDRGGPQDKDLSSSGGREPRGGRGDR